MENSKPERNFRPPTVNGFGVTRQLPQKLLKLLASRFSRLSQRKRTFALPVKALCPLIALLPCRLPPRYQTLMERFPANRIFIADLGKPDRNEPKGQRGNERQKPSDGQVHGG
jgi:hypothetical protein